MIQEAEILDMDARRRAAMVAADVSTLESLLSDRLVWTHSSGKVDDKSSFIAGIGSGIVHYLELETEEVEVLSLEDVAVVHGILRGRASRDGVEKQLSNRFLSVWVRSGDALQMVAWQSTGF